MKVYRKIILSIESGRVLTEDSFEYSGPMLELKGGTKTTVSIPKPSAEEKEAQEMANLINQVNLDALGYTVEGEPGARKLVKRPLTAAELEEQDFNKQATAALREQLLGQPSEATQKRVGDVYQSQRERGERDLTRFATEIAGMRGMNVTDTPVAKELFLSRGDLESSLRGAEAGSLLNVGQSDRLFAQAMNEFQNNLRQQALANRASVGESFAQTALGMGRQRSQQTTTKTSGGDGNLFGMISGGLGGVGGLFSGLGAMGAAGMFSSQEFKEDIVPLDKKDYREVLDELDDTPLFRWNYKPEFEDTKRHIGPITELAPKDIVSEDGKFLVPVDTFGFLFSAVKGLNEKVKELEKDGS